MTAQRMLEMGYPNPRSSVYYCLPVHPIEEGPEVIGNLGLELAQRLVRELAPKGQDGAPVATTWARFVALLATHTSERQ